MTSGIRLDAVHVNGVRLSYASSGAGPLVVLLHGFPESWYSWRHQLEALGNAGFRAVAPDQRGYGESAAPPAIESYDQVELAGDVAALIEALGEESAIVVGHDWGAPVAWHTALLHPTRVRAVAGLSIPWGGRPPMSPLGWMQKTFSSVFFYMLYFQAPGVAEAELEADVRASLSKMLFTWSGNAPLGLAITPKPPEAKFLDGMGSFETLPAWLGEADLEHYVAAFEKSGFRGPLNWYRNFDRTWERTALLADAVVDQPALFIAGERDGALLMSSRARERMKRFVPKLAGEVIVDGAGHWVQQEAPEHVNRTLVEFARSVT